MSYVPPEIRELHRQSLNDTLRAVAARHDVRLFPDDPHHKHAEESLLALADLAAILLHMIDDRRAEGVKFDASYNEDVLRAAVASLPAYRRRGAQRRTDEP